MFRTAWVVALLATGATACRREAPPPLAEAARAQLQHDDKHDLAHAIPIFSVGNLRASQAYYRDVLGFKVDWEDGEPPDFTSVSRGGTTIFFCQRCQGRGGAWIMVFTRDVDRLHRELADKGARIREPPRDMPWKLREMLVSDPDGNVIRFAGRIEH